MLLVVDFCIMALCLVYLVFGGCVAVCGEFVCCYFGVLGVLLFYVGIGEFVCWCGGVVVGLGVYVVYVVGWCVSV